MSVVTKTSATGVPAYSETLPNLPESAGTARRLVRVALDVWHLGELTDAAELIVTELVANAANHVTRSAIRVTITRTGPQAVRVAVVDKSHERPKRQQPGPTEMTGRGLAIVEAISKRWGVDMRRWGKQVWVDLEAEAS
ncbi:ATP-binding protein [Streptomyces lydicus]|uniref:ATP-binding protein n=1 Tax=Streptomyces lydicus TaxID=47763 RepID=UPI0010104F76|nr:ATP-binding protein [Streptomyces lydicus]MCZ1012287.1 ATP-binding protein [Streptomyces lydicus]